MEQTLFQEIINNPWGHLTLWIFVIVLASYIVSMKETIVKLIVLVFALPWFSVALYHILIALGIEFIDANEEFWYFKISLPIVILIIQPTLYGIFYRLRTTSFRKKIWSGKKAGDPNLKFKKLSQKLDEIGRVRAVLLKHRKPDEEAQRKLDHELQVACKERWPDLSFISALLEKGADVNAKDEEGLISLHFTTEWMNKRFSLILFLIGAGADPNIQNEAGQTALGFYASHIKYKLGHQYAVEALAAYSDLNIQDKDGKTALFYQAENASENRWSFLLIRMGADIHTVDKQGKSVLDYATEGQNRKLVAYLNKKAKK